MTPLLSRLAALIFPLAIALTLTFAGCATNGSAPHAADRPALLPAPTSLPASRVAAITIYHPDFDEGGGNPTVSINGVEVVSPSVGTVFTTRLAPGTYHFELDGNRAGDLQASAGQKYFFQIATAPNSSGGGTPRLGIVSPQQARDETARLHPIGQDDINAEAFR